MRGPRPFLFWLALPAALLLVLVAARSRGHAQTESALDIVMGVGLPGIDRGQVVDDTRVPGSPDAARRHGLQPSAAVRERVGAGGARVITTS